MAKQPSKSARADSSAGQSAAAVSSNTDAVAAAEPVTPKAPDAAADHAVADDNANIRDEARRRGVYAGCMCSWGFAKRR